MGGSGAVYSHSLSLSLSLSLYIMYPVFVPTEYLSSLLSSQSGYATMLFVPSAAELHCEPFEYRGGRV